MAHSHQAVYLVTAAVGRAVRAHQTHLGVAAAVDRLRREHTPVSWSHSGNLCQVISVRCGQPVTVRSSLPGHLRTVRSAGHSQVISVSSSPYGTVSLLDSGHLSGHFCTVRSVCSSQVISVWSGQFVTVRSSLYGSVSLFQSDHLCMVWSVCYSQVISLRYGQFVPVRSTLSSELFDKDKHFFSCYYLQLCIFVADLVITRVSYLVARSGQPSIPFCQYALHSNYETALQLEV